MKNVSLYVVLLMTIFVNNMVGCNNSQQVNVSPNPMNLDKPIQTGVSNKNDSNQNNTAARNSKVVSEEKYDDHLCTEDEEVLISFKTEDSPKTLSVCVEKNQSEYIVYRFGTKEKIELEFPSNKVDSWNKFTYSYYLRGGGEINEGMDSNYLSFENGEYEYCIYEEYFSKDKSKLVGIKITNKTTNKEINIKGSSDLVKGSLIKLRENNKIKTENS